jgi:hypothetical protein
MKNLTNLSQITRFYGTVERGYSGPIPCLILNSAKTDVFISLQTAQISWCGSHLSNEYPKEFDFIYFRGGQPAAQKEISAAQTRIENQRFFNILGISSGFCYHAAQKAYNFGEIFNLRPNDQFGLATPDLFC